jgi:hypothetical protein
MGDMNAMGSAANPVFEKTPIPLNPPKPIKASIVGAKAKKKDRVVLPITVLIVEGMKQVQRWWICSNMEKSR